MDGHPFGEIGKSVLARVAGRMANDNGKEGRGGDMPRGLAWMERVWERMALATVLLVAIWGVYGDVGRHGWVAWDDNGYIYENARVKEGVNWKGIQWALTTGEMSNWHPLTWMSLMLDRELFGDWPGGGHWENAALHWVNALLLWWVLGRLTGCWRAGWWAALLWAVHPLRAESVAWASERKDLLATLFGLAAVVTYAQGATQRRTDELTGRNGSGGVGQGRTWGVAGWMAASLMCKPTMVTLPCVLLLLDGWPLERWRREGAWELVKGKWMLWGLAAGACAVTLAVQRDAMSSLRTLEFGERLATALTGYGWYLKKWVCPTGLAFFYPREWADVSWRGAAECGVVLLGASAATAWVWKRKGWGWCGVGWYWFLGTLVPMIGLVQVGRQVWADRYSYWPEMGLWLGVAGMVKAWSAGGRRSNRRRKVAGVAGMVLAGVLGWLAREQVATWSDGETLARKALAVTGKNEIAERVLGEERYRRGDWAGALHHWERAAGLNGQNSEIWIQVGMARYAAGDRAGARAAWERAVAVSPSQWKAMNNLAWMALEEERMAEARKWIERALEHPAARIHPEVLDTEAKVREAEKGTIRGAGNDFREPLWNSREENTQINQNMRE